MRSMKSRIILWMVRNRHLMKFRLKPEVVDESFSVEEFRESVSRTTSRMKIPEGVTLRAAEGAPVNAEWIIPEGASSGEVLLYVHGGGFISGSCETHRSYGAKFALGAGIRVLLFNYRLAPEYPFPAAVEDCDSIYRWLLSEGFKPADIVTGGESAGATLVLSLLLSLKASDVPFPAAAFSISPVTDLRCQADSFTYNLRNDIAPPGSAEVWLGMYIGGNDPVDPLLSPQFGDLAGLPPLHICVGTCEIHYDDCVNFARKAVKHGVDVTLREWPGMVHAFPLFAPLFPEASAALEDICRFIRERLSGT